MSKLRQLVKNQKGRVYFTDNGVAKFVFSLPRTATLLSLDVQVKTAFDDTGTDLLKIGTESDDNFFVADFSVASQGFVRCTMLQGGPLEDLKLLGPVSDIFVTYTGANSDATVGEAIVIATYADPFNNPA